jgi:hypothetical protein
MKANDMLLLAGIGLAAYLLVSKVMKAASPVPLSAAVPKTSAFAPIKAITANDESLWTTGMPTALKNDFAQRAAWLSY